MIKPKIPETPVVAQAELAEVADRANMIVAKVEVALKVEH